MSLSLLSRYAFFAACVLFTLASLPFTHHEWLWPFTLSTAILSLIGVFDLLQQRHAVRRNYPILGNIRYLVEAIRPEFASTCWRQTATPCRSPAPSARWCMPGRRMKPRTNPSAP